MLKRIVFAMALVAGTALADPTFGSTTGAPIITVSKSGGSQSVVAFATGWPSSGKITLMWSNQGAPAGCTESAPQYNDTAHYAYMNLTCTSSAVNGDYQYTVGAYDDSPSGHSAGFIFRVTN